MENPGSFRSNTECIYAAKEVTVTDASVSNVSPPRDSDTTYVLRAILLSESPPNFHVKKHFIVWISF